MKVERYIEMPNGKIFRSQFGRVPPGSTWVIKNDKEEIRIDHKTDPAGMREVNWAVNKLL